MLTQQIQSIKNDFTNGSTQITKNALTILQNALSYYPDNLDSIKKIANELILAKPAMAALKNCINYFIDELSIISAPYNNYSILDIVLQRMNYATDNTIKSAMNLLINTYPDYSEIITCSYSSTILEFFKRLSLINQKFVVISIESIWKNINYSENVKSYCKTNNIKVRIIKIWDLKQILSTNSIAIIGTDRILSNGSVINGYPSLSLAKACHCKIPLYVLGESFKRDDSIAIEEGFELIPQKYISEIITD